MSLACGFPGHHRDGVGNDKQVLSAVVEIAGKVREHLPAKAGRFTLSCGVRRMLKPASCQREEPAEQVLSVVRVDIHAHTKRQTGGEVQMQLSLLTEKASVAERLPYAGHRVRGVKRTEDLTPWAN